MKENYNMDATKRVIKKIGELIADDIIAITYQSLTEYRSRLMKGLKEIAIEEYPPEEK
jgi:hypothetical protein